MAELPHPWRLYAQLQSQLSRNFCVDDQVWGIEAGLDLILATPPDIPPPANDNILRVVNSTRRREQRRSRLRLLYLRPDEDRPDLEQALFARSELRRITSQLHGRDWYCCTLSPSGEDYAQVASKLKSKPGAVRVRVLRLRRQLAPKARTHPE
jgi:hypothetical protein